MNPTLRPAPPRHYYSPVTRVGAYLHVHYPELSSRSWDQVIRGPANVPARFVAICEAATALGDTVLLERLLAPVEATVAGAPIPPFGPAIRLTAQMADLAEDESEARWIADPSTDHLRAWLRAIDAQRAAHRSLRMSIATHLEAL
jgi:hypothetical protein